MMKYTFLLLVSAFACLSLHGQTKKPAGTLIQPTDKNIQYIGRIEDSRPERPVFTYPGVQIRCGFTGTSLSMMAKQQSGYFMAEIDGGDAFKVSFLGNTIVTLASHLPKGIHQAIITYISEGYERLPEFRGFFVDEGASLAPATPLPSRKIEFIGNSITCGYGIEANEPTAPYLEETANYYYTYAARTARNLNAQAVVVARSGIGVYRNYNGPQTGDAVNMNTEYPYTLLYNKKYEWDFSRYTPDVVCINLGTNDTSTDNYDGDLLLEAYRKFLRQVRGHHPKAKIVLLCGSMLNGKELELVRHHLDQVCQEAHRQGDNEVYRFDFTPQSGDLKYGASWHPSLWQHEKMAGELTAYLRVLMGWFVK